MLALLKIARIASGHGKSDNWVDLAGYAACGGEIQAAMNGGIPDGAATQNAGIRRSEVAKHDFRG